MTFGTLYVGRILFAFMARHPALSVTLDFDDRVPDISREGYELAIRITRDSRFNYINVAIWENEKLYWKRFEASVTHMKPTLQQVSVEMTPALYQIREANGAFRVIYVANAGDAVYVLHCFQKKTRKTSKADIDLAAKRYRNLTKELE